MSVNVKSRIHRTIKDFENYREITAENAGELLDDLVLANDEICYGIYENKLRERNEQVAITNNGLHLFRNGSWILVKYADIEEVKFDADKSEADALILLLKQDKRLELPVRGRKGKFRDVFEFSRFLNRVISDVNKKNVTE
mgnify:CR=1 FL=1